MYVRLQNKVALITGGASGIGEATVRLFVEEGAQVIIADINGENEKKLATELGKQVMFEQTDVTEETSVLQLIEKINEAFGTIDILFNNAGQMGPIKPSEQLEKTSWDQVIAVNLTGLFLVTKYVVPLMKNAGSGSIVNNASVLGHIGQAETLANTTTKGGVINLTRTLALEYASDNIRVNAVSPGYINTPLVQALADDQKAEFIARQPLGRLGNPREVAQAVLFLASDEASFITGTNLFVDGGYSAH